MAASQSERSFLMILADKIIDLRKKNGWSQEELADRLGVSRQSVSKWEGAQSVPDMNKILKLSEVFGVSTDYLLKDEISEPDGNDLVPVDEEVTAVRVEMEEASQFLEFRNIASNRIALGVMLCILSPVLLVMMAGLQEVGRISLTENQAAGIGLTVLLILVGIAVALFVLTSIQGNRYEYLEKEAIDTAYGVDGMVRDRREKYRSTYTRQLTIGIVICVISAIPLFFVMTVFGTDDGLPMVASVDMTLILIALGVFLIVRSCMIWSGMDMLLEEGDFTPSAKAEERRNAPIAQIYWCLIIALYLGYSFITARWHESWIIWPVAGVLYGLLTAVLKVVRGKA